MTALDFARLLIKLMGVFVLSLTLVQLSQAISYLPTYANQGSLLAVLFLYLVPILFSALIGWFLFKSDRLIADKVMFTDTGDNPSASLNFEKAEEILISILGVYLIATGLIDLARTLGWLISSTSATSGYGTLVEVYLIPALAEIVIGALVFLSSRGISVLRRRFLDLRDKTRALGIDE